MPNSRKNRKPFHSKRIISESEDGWSRVERTTQSSDRRGVKTTYELVPPADKSLTVEKLQEEHKKFKQQWVEDGARSSLERHLRRKMPQGGWPVEKAFCVALGSLSSSWSLRRRSVWQFVVFMDVVDMIQANMTGGSNIQLYAQEPRFTDLDKKFLESMDVTVLETPEAQEQVDERSFTFIPCLEWSTEIPFIQKGKDFPLYITSSLDWVREEAERMKVWATNKASETVDHTDADECSHERLLGDCEDALAAAKDVLDTHDHYKAEEPGFDDDHSISFNVYTKMLEENESSGGDIEELSHFRQLQVSGE